MDEVCSSIIIYGIGRKGCVYQSNLPGRYYASYARDYFSRYCGGYRVLYAIHGVISGSGLDQRVLACGGTLER